MWYRHFATKRTWRWEKFGSVRTVFGGQTSPECEGIRLNWTRVAFLGPPRTNPDIMLASGNVSIEKRHRETNRAGAGIKSRGRVFAHVLHRRPDLFADSKLCRTMHRVANPFRSRIIKWEKRNLYGCPFVGLIAFVRNHWRFNRMSSLFAKKEKITKLIWKICIFLILISYESFIFFPLLTFRQLDKWDIFV